MSQFAVQWINVSVCGAKSDVQWASVFTCVV